MPVSVLRRLPYYARFALGWASGRPLPAIAGMSVTDVCNLDCGHCWRKNQGKGHVPYRRIVETLAELHATGGRYLYLQGGEPFCWRDGDLRLRDVVRAARRAGFFHVAVCTNGTFPLDAEPDSFSVSLEGLRPAHDRIRCGSFDRVVKNIRASAAPKTFINVTFNRENKDDLEPLARWTASESRLRGLLVNFHIPYPGVESLALSREERSELARRALMLKRSGLPIMNTAAGLRALERNDWRRPIPISVVTDCTETFACCRAKDQPGICDECGYGLWAEAALMLKPHIPSAFEGLLRLHRS